MSPTSVLSEQRFSAGRKCPACGGWDGAPGKRRCNGFIGDKGQVYCRRERSEQTKEFWGIRFYTHWPDGDDRPHTTKTKAKKKSEPAPKRKPDLIHEYVDLKGTLVLEVLRWYTPAEDPKDPDDKRISQRIPDPDKPGEYLYRDISKSIPVGLLYRWPDVQAVLEASAHPLYICEGETDADAVIEAGAAATTNPMGSDGFKEPHAKWIASIESSSRLILCMDRDAAGHKRCTAVKELLEGAGVDAARIKIVRPVVGQDVRNHLEAGHELDSLVPVEDSELEQDESRLGKLRRIATTSTIESMLSELGFAAAEPREYIIKDFLPAGIVGLIVAEGGTGKGHLMVHMGMSLALAQPFGPFDVEKECGWIYVTYEDDYDEVHRRIINHRQSVADRLLLDDWEREALLRNVRVVDYSGMLDAVLSEDLISVLADTRATIPTERCVIALDPLTKILPADVQLNSAEGAGMVMRYLWTLSAEAKATCLAAHHLRKPSASQSEEQRAGSMHDTMGSAQLVNLSRWVLNVSAVDPSDLGLIENHQAVRCEVTKSNYTAAIPPMAFVRRKGGALVWREIPEDRLSDAEAAVLGHIEQKGWVLTVELEKQARQSHASGGMGLGKTAFEQARKSLLARGLLVQSHSQSRRVQYAISQKGKELMVFVSGHGSDDTPVSEEEEEF